MSSGSIWSLWGRSQALSGHPSTPLQAREEVWEVAWRASCPGGELRGLGVGHHGWSRLASQEFPAWEGLSQAIRRPCWPRDRRTLRRSDSVVVAWMPGECSQEPVCEKGSRGSERKLVQILTQSLLLDSFYWKHLLSQPQFPLDQTELIFPTLYDLECLEHCRAYGGQWLGIRLLMRRDMDLILVRKIPCRRATNSMYHSY